MHDLITLDKYIELIPGRRSALIDEFRKKILSKPGKHSQSSVFFKLTKDQLAEKK